LGARTFDSEQENCDKDPYTLSYKTCTI